MKISTLSWHAIPHPSGASAAGRCCPRREHPRTARPAPPCAATSASSETGCTYRISPPHLSSFRRIFQGIDSRFRTGDAQRSHVWASRRVPRDPPLKKLAADPPLWSCVRLASYTPNPPSPKFSSRASRTQSPSMRSQASQGGGSRQARTKATAGMFPLDGWESNNLRRL